MGYFGGSYKGNPKLKARREAIRAYWFANPAASTREVAAVFDIDVSHASTMKPYAVRQMDASARPLGKTGRQIEQEELLKRMYAEDATLAEMAEAANLSQTTVRRYLRGLRIHP